MSRLNYVLPLKIFCYGNPGTCLASYSGYFPWHIKEETEGMRYEGSAYRRSCLLAQALLSAGDMIWRLMLPSIPVIQVQVGWVEDQHTKRSSPFLGALLLHVSHTPDTLLLWKQRSRTFLWWEMFCYCGSSWVEVFSDACIWEMFCNCCNGTTCSSKPQLQVQQSRLGTSVNL